MTQSAAGGPVLGVLPRIAIAGAFVAMALPAIGDPAYFPGRQWERRAPAAAGFDPAALDGAIRYAQQNEVPWERDVFKQIQKDVANEPYPAILGETRERGGPAGMIVRDGYLVAQWGDIDRVDMSFSVAKSYLSTVAGLAVDAGLITDVNDRVCDYVQDGGFDGSRNRKVTWHMLLNQTSEWEGTLWDKPDVADRRRGYDRKLQAPGTFWEYNDVRVNRLALALLRVYQRPLPEVLKEKVMDPIGASDTWVWHGYRNSYVDIGGRRVQSVSGGSHWGGGFWASTRDHARFGYLLLRRGEWNGKRILSERWVDMATQPTAIAPHYGYLWWLSQNRQGIFPSAPESSFFALGSGGNMIWIAPEFDLVVVTRWLDIPKLDGFITRVSAALQAETKN
jgi:CubicO group peptidase (beta-lactamase class C family)